MKKVCGILIAAVVAAAWVATPVEGTQWPIRIGASLITRDKVDLVLGPYKGRKFIFGVLPPSETRLEGLIDLAARKGLKSVAVINVDDLARRVGAQGTIELAKKKGLDVVFAAAYPLGNIDFSAILTRVRAANPDVLVGSTRFDDGIAITRQMKGLNVNPRMYGLTVGVDTIKFYEALGRDAEFVYGATPWVPELVEVRAGGLIPVARQYPGAREFVEGYKKEFPGGFRVDRDGAQIGHKVLLFQWQEGKKVIVWPEELAPGTVRFPTPPWSQRP